ncbi:13948_t:CDS:2 [Entrophospora sp. SA101]|nr:13948_t:CDS:2 [Entrophospora sp. SA101]
MPRKSPITRKILITVVFLTLAVASSWIIIHHSRKTEEPKKIELKANNNQNQENNQVPDDFPQSNENSEQNPPKIEENKTPKVEEPKGQKEEPKTPPPPSQPNQEEKIRSIYKKSDDTFRHYDSLGGCNFSTIKEKTINGNLVEVSCPRQNDEVSEKLTYYGLETKIVEDKNNLCLEFDVLPNRIVQEMGVILNCQVKPVDFLVINESEEKLVEVIINTNDCSEFYLGLIKDIEVKEINNIRTINNVVDSANLLMLESGQPLHIFDYDALPEQKIVVRPAHQGEKLNALHGQELLLNSKDVVISSGEKVISLAGIIGSHETAITPQTKNILIECASFNPKLIKKTAKRLNISTAASHFFSRGANLVLTTQQVLARFILLIADNYQSDLNSKIFFSYQNQTAKKIPPIITISEEFITKKVGQKLTEQTVESV